MKYFALTHQTILKAAESWGISVENAICFLDIICSTIDAEGTEGKSGVEFITDDIMCFIKKVKNGRTEYTIYRPGKGGYRCYEDDDSLIVTKFRAKTKEMYIHLPEQEFGPLFNPIFTFNSEYNKEDYEE